MHVLGDPFLLETGDVQQVGAGNVEGLAEEALGVFEQGKLVLVGVQALVLVGERLEFFALDLKTFVSLKGDRLFGDDVLLLKDILNRLVLLFQVVGLEQVGLVLFRFICLKGYFER